MKTVTVVTIAFGVISLVLASPPPPCPSDGSVVQFFPDSDCTKYWQCSNGVGYLKSCPQDGTNWNPVKNVCDWAESAGCTGEGWSTTAAPTTVRTTTVRPTRTASTTTARPTTTTRTTTVRPTRPTRPTTTRRPTTTTKTTTAKATTTTRTTTVRPTRPTRPTRPPSHRCDKWKGKPWAPWWCRPPFYPPPRQELATNAP